MEEKSDEKLGGIIERFQKTAKDRKTIKKSASIVFLIDF
jgi:hypothetical protein